MWATYFCNHLSILCVYFLLFHYDSSNLQGFFSFFSGRAERDPRKLLTSICGGVCRVCSCSLSACTWITSRSSGTLFNHTQSEPCSHPPYSPYPVKTFHVYMQRTPSRDDFCRYPCSPCSVGPAQEVCVPPPGLGVSPSRQERCCCHNPSLSGEQGSKTCCLQHFAYSALASKPCRLLQQEFTLSNLFIDCIPGPEGICSSRACDQGRDRNPLYCTGWFSKCKTWAPPFHFLIYLCMFYVLIFCIDLLLRL